MQRIGISKLRSGCSAILERVRQTGQTVLITRCGLPLAEIRPVQRKHQPKIEWLGRSSKTGRILGDIVGPVQGEGDWEAAGTTEPA